MCPRCGGDIGDGLLMCAACFAAGPSRATRIKTERERQREREKSRRYYARKRVDVAWRKRRVARRDRERERARKRAWWTDQRMNQRPAYLRKLERNRAWRAKRKAKA